MIELGLNPFADSSAAAYRAREPDGQVTITAARSGGTRVFLWPLLLLLGGAAMSLGVAELQQRRALEAQREDVRADLETVRGALSRELFGALHLTEGIAGLITIEGGLSEEKFQRLAGELFRRTDLIRNVVIAPDNVVTAVLTGIPKGATGNMGSISFASPTELIVATGNAGNAADAENPSSLAGKIFTIDPNRTDPKPEIRASGLGSNVALCPSSGADGQLYVADSGSAGDRLSLVGPKGLQPVWSWADRPGVSGCAVGESWIAVSIAKAKRIDTFIRPSAGSASIGEPTPMETAKTYGAVGRMTSVGGAAAQLATINKSTPGANVKSFDDRVAIFQPKAGDDLR